MRRPFVLSLFVLALAIRSTAETRQARNPELRYYADAYADHYGVPRALARLLVAYGRAGDGEFLETLRRPFTNPIAQRDDKGSRKVHPLFIVAVILLILAAAAMTFFSFRS